MKKFHTSLITKIALLVIFVEMVAFGSLGWFYIDRFSSAADQEARSRLELVGQLIAEEELQVDAISRQTLMTELLGADYVSGMVVGGNGRVIVSSEPTYLGRAVREIPGFNAALISDDSPDVQFIPGERLLTCVMRINGTRSSSVYHTVVTIDTREILAEKRSIVIWGWSVSLAFILLSSIGIILLAHRFIGRRVDATLKVLKQVESGAMDVRIPVSSRDEMGQLQIGINSMIGTLSTLLVGHRRNEEELSAILDSISEGLIAIDRDTRIVRFNGHAQDLLGTDVKMTASRPLADYLPELAGDDIPPWLAALQDGETTDNIQFERHSRAGQRRFMSIDCGPIRGADQSIAGAVLVARDITDRQAAEEQLRLAANVFTHAREGIVITDTDGTIVNVNNAFTQITGYSREEVIGKNPRVLKSERHDRDFYVDMWRSMREQGYWMGEIWNRRKGGEVYAEMLTISAVRDPRGEIQQYVGLFFDITLQKQQQQQLEYSAHYDSLTRLPNRVLLADRLHQSMKQAERRKELVAVVYLDLDGFKSVNDRFGHDMGDKLLVKVAQRMQEALREGDTIARLGGDEFVAVLVDLPETSASDALLNRLLAAVNKRAVIDGIELQVTASLGVTFYPQSEEVDADQLLRQADQAMYQAKLAGRNRYQLFDTEQYRSVRGHHESVENIRRALDNREFVLHYQPQVNMRTGEIVGVEALIRWQHPERGVVSPAFFLPVIEDHPLTISLGEWVLDTALGQLEKWHASGLNISVSVNVSALHLQQANFVKRLQEILGAHPRIGPGHLKLEVLETSALNDINHVSQIIMACDSIGVSFALDDFGTGYSSLTYLKRLPASQLKIDQTFVRDMLDDPEDLAILEGTLSLATAFRRQVIAEGVESRAHGELLLQLGCDLAQGYGIARPMPAERVRKWVATWRPYTTWANQPLVSREDLPLLFAGVELRAWMRHFEASLKDTELPPPPLDHFQCSFGHWLQHEGKMRYGSTPAYQEIKQLHMQVHTLAGQLLESQTQGDYPAAGAAFGDLHKLKDRLLATLQLLRRDEQKQQVG
ncbi:MAG: EAL domain-containing protein [Gammaproteobacteria bacterium]|nr:EAL domain-containing protein [Gammaproteobacteria bacterium]